MGKEGELSAMEVDERKSNNSDQITPKFSINVLQLLKSSQMQHGLRHRDYTRYRRYCTARLRRLYKSLKFTHGRGKYTKKAVTESTVTDVRFLHLVLYSAERAWSHAMEKRQLPDGPNARQRIYLIGRLRKAVKWATLFSNLCSVKGDSRTSLEAEAYASYMKGNLLFEQEQNWDTALKNFKSARAVYEELGKYGDLDNQVLCRERVEELEPSIQYCLHKIGESNLQASELLHIGEMEGPALDLFKAKLEAVMAEERSQQAASLTEFHWLGHRFPISNAKTRVAILKAQELEKDLHGPAADTLPAEKRLVIFDKIFSAYQEARSSIRSDLVSAGNAENVKDDLNGLDKAVSAVLGQRTIERNQLLVSIAKNKLSRRRDDKSEKVTKPEELVRLYDLLLQNTADLSDLVSSGRNRKPEEVAFAEECQLKSLAFRAERCFYLARSYSLAGKRQRFLSFSRLPNQNTNSTDQLPSGNKTFSTMSHPYTPQPQQLLPQSVEELLRRICTEQNQPPINSNTRAKLADLGEEEALSILREISPQKIRRSLDGFINYLANMGSPLKRPCLSSRQNCSLTSTDPHSRLLMYPQDDAQTPNIRQEHQMFTPMVADGANGQRHSPQLLALGELEFRKAFLILNYIGDKKLEEAISADEIGRLKNLQMYNFEQQLWNSLGQYNIMEEDRRKCFDWDSGQTHIYHCHVSRSGSYRFKGPYLQETTTHMHRVLGDDNVLMVKFAEEMSDNGAVRMNDDEQYTKYHNIAKEGILVGLRRYYFFVFKDGGKEKKKTQNTSSMKCYFVRLESDASVDKDKTYALSGKTVSEARSVFMHVNTMPTLAKYMARFSLILSKTIKMEVDLADVNIQRIDDIKCQDINGNVVCDDDGQPHIQTDGTGFISEDLALKCPKNVSQGRHIANGNTERLMTSNEHEKKFSEINSPQPPLLIQFRLFNNGSAVKGTFLVNRKLPFRTIQNRPSMIKVETDPRLSNTSTKNSFEIVTTSNKPRKTCLSRNLIALLSYGGIPDNFFMHSLVNAMEEAGGVLSNTRSALKVSLNRGEMDDLNAARMILSGIPLDEPYLQYHLSILMKEEKKSLKAGKLPVEESYYLMGTVDPTGLLEPNEVCIILDNGQISGKVLVYRNPGLHFGDIHILKARYLKALEDIVGNAKYAIFFPCKGPRSLADEMAGGDYDGDMYFVSKNPQLLEHFTQSKPMPPTSSTPHVSSKRPCDFSPQELEEELFNLYLAARFQPSYTIGAAADYWLAIMDRYLSLGDDSSDEKAVMKKKLVQLIEIYYDALDAPKKSGRKIEIPKELQPDMFPHYMEREPKRSFTSTSILGLIYDKVKSNEAEDPPITEVNKLPCFDKAPESCLTKWGELYEKYRQEMSEACKQEGQKKKEAANEIIRKYKQELYEAAEFEESKRSLQELYNDALAIYHVTYDHASKKGKASLCKFAWKVAGAVLCRLHATKQAERSMVCLPSVLKRVLG